MTTPDTVSVPRADLDRINEVFYFDLRKMRVFGPDFNQAVKDAGDRLNKILSAAPPVAPGDDVRSKTIEECARIAETVAIKSDIESDWAHGDDIGYLVGGRDTASTIAVAIRALASPVGEIDK